MANVETKDTFHDLGKFKSIDCEKVLEATVCQVNFTEGKLTLTKKELDNIFKMESLIDSRRQAKREMEKDIKTFVEKSQN